MARVVTIDPAPSPPRQPKDSAPLLRVRDLGMRFGGVVALDGVELAVQSNELHAVIGPNGAGKSTLLNCLSGIYLPTTGSMLFGDTELVGSTPVQVARAGMGRTFQNLALFPSMTVEETLLLGRHTKMRASIARAVLRPLMSAREERMNRQTVQHLLDLLNLSAYSSKRPFELPYGISKRVEIARALAMEPRLLLLDEPAAGLNTAETAGLASYLERIRQEHELSIILIEHDMDLVMSTSDLITVLDFGRVIASGTPAEIARDPKVTEAYLGVGDGETSE